MVEQQAEEEFGWADITVDGERCHVRLSGEISSEMRPRLDAVLEELAGQQRPVDVDLGQVSFIDSTGIGFFARLGIQHPGAVRVRNASGLTADLLTMSGLTKVLDVDPPG